MFSFSVPVVYRPGFYLLPTLSDIQSQLDEQSGQENNPLTVTLHTVDSSAESLAPPKIRDVVAQTNSSQDMPWTLVGNN